MRIATYAPHYEDLGGIREIVAQLGTAFVAGGHELEIVARARRAAPSGTRLRDDATGGRLFRVRLQGAPYRGAGGRAYRRFLRHFPTSAIRLVRHLRAIGPDVIATHSSKFHVPYVLAMRVAVRAPVVVHLQNAARTADGPESITLMRLLLRAADRIVACSPPVADYARQCRPDRATRIATVPNGVERAAFSDAPPAIRPRPYVLAVGRLAEQKGFDVLIDAFAEARTPLDLVLAGDGPDRGALERAAAVRGITERVAFLGAVDRATVASLMRGAALVAMPSRFEGHPLVCLEAMQAGAALVASDIPGLPEELRDGQTGVIVPPDDASALAAAIRGLAAAPERAQALGRAARTAAASFPGWREIAERVMAQYELAVRGGAPRVGPATRLVTG